ncbi:MAG: SMC-Scp complex subunit ScpB [Elusimicrobia bacterium]|nr:SMC-Scp complex subunit ScpB [Elusimicrobiota bacterium]
MSSPEAENADAETTDAAEAPAEATAESIAASAPDEAPAPSPANDPALLRRALEGLLFITDRPLSAGELCKLVNVRDQDRIVACVEDLRRELEERNLGYRLIAVAEGWQMATRPELAPYMRKLFSDRATMRLSTAAQETLSIISYKQPLTRAEVEEIRGVEVIAALETLLEKRLIKVVGRKETVGRPLMYGTTMEFLRHFGLRSLEDLPPLDRFAPADAAAPAAPIDTPHAAERPAPEAETIGEQTEEAVIAEALSEHPAEESVAEQTEEAVIAEALSEHPAEAPEAAAEEAPEEEEKEGLWPK